MGKTSERKVIIATPCLTGQVSAWYLDAIVDSVRLCSQNSIQLFPLFLTNESILPMARNELLGLAFQSDAESMVFIDSDQWWDSNALLKVLNYKQDVVGLPVVDKTDNAQSFNVRVDSLETLSRVGDLIEVKAVGTGFLKLSQNAIRKLHDSGETVLFRGKEVKEVFKYGSLNPVDGQTKDFVGEDIGLCYKLRELGFKIWVDTTSTCSHIGSKIWHGDFSNYISNL
jgi:hypothetical protein